MNASLTEGRSPSHQWLIGPKRPPWRSRRSPDCATHWSTPMPRLPAASTSGVSTMGATSSGTSDLLDCRGPEQAARPDEHDRDQHAEDDEVGVVAVAVALRERLDESDEEAAEHRARDAA